MCSTFHEFFFFLLLFAFFPDHSFSRIFTLHALRDREEWAEKDAAGMAAMIVCERERERKWKNNKHAKALDDMRCIE